MNLERWLKLFSAEFGLYEIALKNFITSVFRQTRMSATIVSSRLSSKSSSNIADELGRIDDAVAKIEQQIKELRQEKQNLLEKRQRIQRAQENHAAVARWEL